ncbi:MAG: hypothetical protein ACRDT8_12475 [Micromonosporaceae bacterium]
MTFTTAGAALSGTGSPVHLSMGLVRAELDQLGMHYVADVQTTVRRMLHGEDPRRRAGFAAAVAERLLRALETQPPREQPDQLTGRRQPVEWGAGRASGWQPGQTSAWRATLEAVWRGTRGEPDAFAEVSRSIAELYLSPYHRDFARSATPLQTPDNTMAAILYAAQCYLYGCVDFAMWSSACGYDAAAAVAVADSHWSHRRPAAVHPHTWQLAHPAVQAELERQLEDVEAVSAGTVPVR